MNNSPAAQLRRIITTADDGQLSNEALARVIAAILDAGWRPDPVCTPYPDDDPPA